MDQRPDHQDFDERFLAGVQIGVGALDGMAEIVEVQDLQELQREHDNVAQMAENLDQEMNEEDRVRELREEIRVLRDEHRIRREQRRNLEEELRIGEEQQRNMDQATRNFRELREDLHEAQRVFQEDLQWFQQIRRELEALQRNPALAGNRRDPQLQLVGAQRRQRRLENPGQRRQPGQNVVIPMEIELGGNAGNEDGDNANNNNVLRN
ncbi:unnamed protein product [Caenorhabditis nigoni]